MGTSARTVHPLVHLTYPVRVVGCLIIGGIVGSVLLVRGASPLVWTAAFVHTLLWPHVAYFIATRSTRSKAAEERNQLLDSFLVGCWVAAVSFSPWPATTLLSSFFIGVLSAGGARWGLKAAAMTGVGILAVWLAAGVHFEPASTPLTTAICVLGIASYSATFGQISYFQARRLVQARKLSDEQRVHIQETHALLEQARAAADAANKAKSGFLANMSHELRTPLNAIIGYSEMAVETLEVDEEASELTSDLRRITSAGKHLLNLINGVLDLSRIEAGTMQVVVEPFDVVSIVREVAGTARPLASRNGNTLDVRCADDLGAMYSDQTKLRQILLNLLSNASKFTENGRLTLAVTRNVTGDFFLFEVSDTGRGMTPEQVSHLFEPFRVIDPEATRRHGGTGLGLALSRHFATAMGGDIEVRSQRQVGTMFVVRLPMEVPNLTSSGVYIPPSLDSRPHDAVVA